MTNTACSSATGSGAPAEMARRTLRGMASASCHVRHSAGPPRAQNGEDEFSGDSLRIRDFSAVDAALPGRDRQLAKGPLPSRSRLAQGDSVRPRTRYLTPAFVQHCQLGSARIGFGASEYE